MEPQESEPRDRGFTLVELIVVVVIVAILVLLGIPQYKKSVELSYADQAVSELQSLAKANRLYFTNNRIWATNGVIGGPFTSASCSGFSCTPGSNSACNLLACNYLADQNWDSSRYLFYSLALSATQCGLAGTAGSQYVACAKRRPGGPSFSSDWGYTINQNGLIQAYGTNPPPPPP